METKVKIPKKTMQRHAIAVYGRIGGLSTQHWQHWQSPASHLGSVYIYSPPCFPQIGFSLLSSLALFAGPNPARRFQCPSRGRHAYRTMLLSPFCSRIDDPASVVAAPVP